jgi:iron(III) transport system substrate-binding protein
MSIRSKLLSAAAIACGTATFMTGTVQAAGEINLYSARQPFLMNPLLDAFTAKTGVKVNMVYLKKGMLERLKSEGPNSPADLILTADIGHLQNHVDAGVLQETTSAVLSKNVPAQYRDAKGRWYGLTTRARVVYAHKDRVKANEVMTYEDLAKPHMKGRICIRSGKHLYNVSLLASIVTAKGIAGAEEWAKGLKSNLARKPKGNDRAQVKGVYEGECDVAIGNTYYMGKMATNEKSPEQKDWAKSVRIIFPNQADRGTHVNISGAGVTKSAKNKDNAIKLIEFLSGDDAQKIYAEGNFEYPIKAGAKVHPLVASWGTFKADKVRLDEVGTHRREASKIMDRVKFND